MEEEVVNFCRVKDLQIGDRFLLNGTWRYVTKIVDKRVHFKYSYENNNRGSVGANSSQYVQLVKPKINKASALH